MKIKYIEKEKVKKSKDDDDSLKFDISEIFEEKT